MIEAGLDLFVIRGTTVSAEHVSGRSEPLNLKQFIYELDVPVIVGGCATFQAALHLMRTGAAGVLVGFGGGAAHTTRDRAGGRRADGDRGRRRGGGPARLPRRVRRALRPRDRRRLDRPSRRRPKAIACGADAVMIGSPLARATRRPGAAATGGPRRGTPRCRAASGSRSARSAPWTRSCTVPPSSPTAR